MTYDSSNPSWWLPLAIHYHHGNGAVAGCVLGSGVEAVLLTGNKRLVMGDYGFSGLFFFQEKRNWGHMPPFFPLQSLRWGVIQSSTPDQMVSMPLRLSGKKRRWDQKHFSLDGNPPGGRRQEEGANHVQISLTQFLMETLQACQPAFSAASVLSFYCIASLRATCKIHPASPYLTQS